MPELPEDPDKELDDGSLAAHRLFLSYQRAGFTRDEALVIITAIVTKNITPPPNPG